MLAAMVMGAPLQIGAAEAASRSLVALTGDVAAQDCAFAFQLQGPFSLGGVLLLSGPLLPQLVGALLGDPEPVSALDDYHVPILRDSLANVLGRWTQALGELYRAPVTLDLESPLNPRDAASVLRGGALAKGSAVLVERLPLDFNGVAGAMQLLLPDPEAACLITANPAYMPPPEVAPPMNANPLDSLTEQPSVPSDPVPVSRAHFQQLQPHSNGHGESRGLDLLMDVPLTVSVELGRKDLNIRDILELVPGALIELDRLAGEPLDLLINGKLFAKGEVVVIDESFGIRITSIVSAEERIQSMR